MNAFKLVFSAKACFKAVVRNMKIGEAIVNDKLYSCNCKQVNDNGVISFDRVFNARTPHSLPLSGTQKIIAPYWADVDTRITGQIFYRQSTDPILLTRASREIQKAFPSSQNIMIKNLFIATWVDVEYYNCYYHYHYKVCNFGSSILVIHCIRIYVCMYVCTHAPTYTIYSDCVNSCIHNYTCMYLCTYIKTCICSWI